MTKRRGTLLFVIGVSLAASSAVAAGWAVHQAKLARQPVWLGGSESDWFVTDLAFSPSDDWLAARQYDGKLGVWSLRDHRLRRQLSVAGRSSRTTGVGFAVDGRLVLSSGEDELAFLAPPSWAADGVPDRGADRDLSVHGHFAAISGPGWVAIWDLARTPPVRLRRIGTDLDFATVVWSPGGERILAAQRGTGSVVAYETLTGKELSRTATVPVASIAASPAGDLVAIGSSADFTVDLFTFDGASQRHIVLPTPTGLDEPSAVPSRRVTGVAFSPDGGTLVAACSAEHGKGRSEWSSVVLLDLASGRPIQVLDAKTLGMPDEDHEWPPGPVATAVAFSSAGELVAVAFQNRVCVFRAP